MESKRDDFRKYLEKAGVMDALTKILVGLYECPEKPNDALSYVLKSLLYVIQIYSLFWSLLIVSFRYLKTHLSAAHPDQAELESMRNELHFAHRQIELLK